MDQKKVATEVAEQEFARWAEAMGLEFDHTGMDDSDLKTFNVARDRLIKTMCGGALVVSEMGEFVYTPRAVNTSPITFHAPTGDTLMAMDQKKSGHDVAKTMAVICQLTGEPMARFSRMELRDLKVCQAVVVLFLG
jgi:hypothetical protein